MKLTRSLRGSQIRARLPALGPVLWNSVNGGSRPNKHATGRLKSAGPVASTIRWQGTAIAARAARGARGNLRRRARITLSAGAHLRQFRKRILFNAVDGYYPFGSLTLSGSTLYGMAAFGGSSGWGTVFRINTDSSGFPSTTASMMQGRSCATLKLRGDEPQDAILSRTVAARLGQPAGGIPVLSGRPADSPDAAAQATRGTPLRRSFQPLALPRLSISGR